MIDPKQYGAAAASLDEEAERHLALSLESAALEDSFCSEDCYSTAWRERRGAPERRGAIPTIDDGEELEIETLEET